MSSQSMLPVNVRIVGGTRADHPDYPTDDGVMRALAAAEDRHFWHAERNTFIVERLRQSGFQPGSRILDVGCGAGCVSAALERAGHQVTGIDGHLSQDRAGREARSRLAVHRS